MSYRTNPPVPAVAATTPRLDALPPLARADASSPPTMAADAAGGHGSTSATPDAGFEPVDGFTLVSMIEDDSDGFTSRLFFARKDGFDTFLDVSRFNFPMTQDRFAWLALNGFPARRGVAPWFGDEVDAAIASEQVSA